MLKISKIYLYDEPSVPEIELPKLAQFLKKTFSVDVEQRKNIFSLANKNTAQKIASCRVFNTRKPFQAHKPNKEEIAFEEANISDTTVTKNIIMYDGFELQKIITELIPEKELAVEQFHIIFTNKLTCTFDTSDYRYHGRALIGSNPSIISTTGVIEAPAKPREYYFELISNFAQGLNVESMKEKYQGTYLEYHDKRLCSVIEGYLMQAVFYYFTGEPFCDKVECRLYNAHWQKDLIYSQLEVGKLCDKHQKILEQFGFN